MKSFLLVTFLAFLSCKKENKAEVVSQIPTDSTKAVIDHSEIQNVTYDYSVDYDGNGTKETATIIRAKESEGNPVEDGTPGEYSVIFSDKKLLELPIGCCGATIINEGDLDNNGTEEFSVFQSPMNGCTYTMTTYSFKKGTWSKLTEPFLIPTGCGEITTEELEGMVFKQNNKVYIMKTDPNDENLKKTRTEIELP